MACAPTFFPSNGGRPVHAVSGPAPPPGHHSLFSHPLSILSLSLHLLSLYRSRENTNEKPNMHPFLLSSPIASVPFPHCSPSFTAKFTEAIYIIVTSNHSPLKSIQLFPPMHNGLCITKSKHCLSGLIFLESPAPPGLLQTLLSYALSWLGFQDTSLASLLALTTPLILCAAFCSSPWPLSLGVPRAQALTRCFCFWHSLSVLAHPVAWPSRPSKW